MQNIWKGNNRSFYDSSITADHAKESISKKIANGCIRSMNKELNHAARNVAQQLQNGDKKHE